MAFSHLRHISLILLAILVLTAVLPAQAPGLVGARPGSWAAQHTIVPCTLAFGCVHSLVVRRSLAAGELFLSDGAGTPTCNPGSRPWKTRL